MRWFSRLHEGPLIAGLDDEERAVLRTQLHDRNRNVARGLFPLYSAFAVLLVWINARRLQEGLFDESWVYGALMISHAVYALSLIHI